MNYIGLSKQRLTRFSHHWFWGLLVDEQQGENLYDCAFYLQQNPELRQEMEDDVETINLKNWLVRSFYWLFNFNQYRSHYYQLQGYRSLQLYHEVETMLLENVGPVEGGALFALAVASVVAIKYIATPALESLAWFSDKVFSYIPNQDIRIISPATQNRSVMSREVVLSPDAVLPQQNEARTMTSDSSFNFTVRSSMLDALQTLGVNSRVGGSVSLEAVKSAYKAACLRTHPDKTGSQNDVEFKLIGSAYSQLLNLIERELSSEAVSSNSGLGLFADINDVNRRLAILKKEQEQANKDVSSVLDELQRLAEVSERQHEKELEQRNRELEQRNLVIEHQKAIDDLTVRFARLFQEQDVRLAASGVAQAAQVGQQPSAESNNNAPTV